MRRSGIFFFFSSRRRHTRSLCDWSSDVCSSDLRPIISGELGVARVIERGADPLGFGAVERGAGLIDRITLQDQTLVDGSDRCVRSGDCRLTLGNGAALVAVGDREE